MMISKHHHHTHHCSSHRSSATIGSKTIIRGTTKSPLTREKCQYRKTHQSQILIQLAPLSHTHRSNERESGASCQTGHCSAGCDHCRRPRLATRFTLATWWHALTLASWRHALTRASWRHVVRSRDISSVVEESRERGQARERRDGVEVCVHFRRRYARRDEAMTRDGGGGRLFLRRSGREWEWDVPLWEWDVPL